MTSLPHTLPRLFRLRLALRQICNLCIFFILCIATSLANANNLPDIGNSAELLISPEDEKRIGKDFMRHVRRSLKLVDDTIINEYVQNLGDKLASTIDTRGQTLTFFAVEDHNINAFAGPAGYIGIHTGLVAAAKSEGELASVVAHEIAHVTQRHLVRSLESSQNASLATIGALIAAIILGANSDSQVGEAVLASTVAGATQRQLSFSRAHEQEADRVGIEMLAGAGYDPMSMPNFFETLNQHSRFATANIPEFLLTHPVTTTRIADSRGRAAGYKFSSNFSTNPESIQFQLVKARINILTLKQGELEQRTKELENKLATKKLKNIFDLYELALCHQRQNNFSKANQLLTEIIKLDRNRIIYTVTRAEIHRAANDHPAAVKLLADALMLYPNNSSLTLLYAESLISTGKATSALKVSQDQITFGEYPPKLFKVMANAATKANRLSEAYEALGEYYYAYGETNTAIKHFEEATKQTDIDPYRELKLKAKIKSLKSEMINKRTAQNKFRNYFDKHL